MSSFSVCHSTVLVVVPVGSLLRGRGPLVSTNREDSPATEIERLVEERNAMFIKL
jgi:hypothetical protein